MKRLFLTIFVLFSAAVAAPFVGLFVGAMVFFQATFAFFQGAVHALYMKQEERLTQENCNNDGSEKTIWDIHQEKIDKKAHIE